MAQPKFIDRFIDFFLVEQRLKWRVYVTSVVIASAWAVLRFSFSRESEAEISQEAAIILCLLVISSVIVYVAKDRLFPAKAEESRIYPRFSLAFGLAATAGLVLITAMVKIDIPRMQAAIVDTKLETFATFLENVQAANLPEQQLRNRYEKIQSIVGVSSANQIPVDSDILHNTQSAIARSLERRAYSEQTRQLGWTTSIDLESLAYTREVQNGSISLRQINNEGYPISSSVTIKGKTLYNLGDHSLIILNGGAFYIEGSTVVFDKIDFEAKDSASGLYVSRDSKVFVRGSIFQGGMQPLDNITWVNVEFRNAHPVYNGGSIRLRNVTFTNCDTRLLAIRVPVELATILSESDGRPINYVYEPPSVNPLTGTQ